MNKSPSIPISDVIRAAGGLSALARGLGVDRTSIRDWRWVPAERVLEVERLSGVPASVIRPDIYPPSRFASLNEGIET